MYFSRIKFNFNKNYTKIVLKDYNFIHGIVENCFHDYPKRKLWRIDKKGDSTYLLTLSENKPNFKSFAKQVGYDEDSGDILDYDVLKTHIMEDSVWRFKLIACPMKKNGNKGRSIDQSEYKNWLIEKSKMHGFEIKEDDLSIYDYTLHNFKSWSSKRMFGCITFKSATFEGMLKVTDTELFWNALCKGIGNKKAYGNGLLTIAK